MKIHQMKMIVHQLIQNSNQQKKILIQKKLIVVNIEK